MKTRFDIARVINEERRDKWHPRRVYRYTEGEMRDGDCFALVEVVKKHIG